MSLLISNYIKFLCELNFKMISKEYEPTIKMQEINAFPDIFSGQLQMGKWLTILHSALRPQTSLQGSWHLCCIQALSREQSLLITHSGRQPTYGFPKYSGRHVQIPALHWVFDPHKDSLQGSDGSVSVKSYISLYVIT